MLTPTRRILLVTAQGCECYLARGDRLILEAGFNAEQREEYLAFVRSRQTSLFSAMVDQIDEDFRQDSMPFLRGPSRTQLLARKAAQSYRDTPFHTSASIGRETHGRRDERVQFMALTNAEVLNQWLTPLSEAGIRVAAVHSPPLATPGLLALIARRIGARPRQLLVITVDRAGLRQTLLDGNVARFSRVAAVAGESGSAEFVANCVAEINKTQQYVVGLRLISRDSRVGALIIAPPGDTGLWNRPGLFADALEPVVVDLRDAMRAAGLKRVETRDGSSGHDAYADALWIFAAARRRPRLDFAPEWLKEAYRLWQARMAVWAAGGLVLLAGCAIGAERWAAAQELWRDRDVLAAQARSNDAQYERIKRGFPPLPTTPSRIKASVEAFEKLSSRTIAPAALLADIGRALESAPQFRLERLDWLQAGSATDNPGVAQNRGAPIAGAPTERFEIVLLHGSLTGVAREDRRAELDAVQRTVEALSGLRGVSASIDKPPIDLSPRASVTGGERDAGGAGAGRGAGPVADSSAPATIIRVVRKVTK